MTYLISFIILVLIWGFIGLITYLYNKYEWMVYIIVGIPVLLCLIAMYKLIHQSLWGTF